MSEIEMEIRKKLYLEIMDFQKDFFNRRTDFVTTADRKAVNYFCSGLKRAAEIVRAK